MPQTMGGTFNPVQTQTFSNGVLTDATAGTDGVGYAAGAGSTVTQATNKSTAVTLNKLSGAITMNGASLANATAVGFTVNNNLVKANDLPLVAIKSGATANSYTVQVDAVANNSFHISVNNFTGGSLSEALVISFVIIRGVAS